MNYLIVCKSNNQHYLLMTKPDGDKGSSIQAYDSKEAVMKAFKGYTDAFKRDFTWVNSAAIGMMSMQPVAIEAPDSVEVIKPFLTNSGLTHIRGGAMLGGYYDIECSEEILKFKQFELWDQTMVAAGIK